LFSAAQRGSSVPSIDRSAARIEFGVRLATSTSALAMTVDQLRFDRRRERLTKRGTQLKLRLEANRSECGFELRRTIPGVSK
jgi:hypothetical protein